MPSKGPSSLENLWFKALETKAQPNGEIFRIALASESIARWTRFELYKIRTKWRVNSRSMVPKDDPGYDTSPFDRIKLYQTGKEIVFRMEDHSPYDFDLILPEDFNSQPRHRKGPAKKQNSS